MIRFPNIKCGCRLHKGISVPHNAIIKTASNGREFYLSGIDDNTAIVKFIDTDEIHKVSITAYKRL